MEPEDIEKYLPKQENQDDNSNEDPVERRYKFLNDGAEDEAAGSDWDSISEDERVTRVDRMASELDASIRQEKEYKMLKGKKQVKKELKAKALIEL